MREELTCREPSCGAKIIFALSPKGKPLPIDAIPTPDGSYVVAGLDSRNKLLLRVAEPGDVLQRYTSHYKTCTAPNRFTKKGK